MAQQQSDGKPKLSGKLMQLKFMQRAVERQQATQAQAAAVVDAATAENTERGAAVEHRTHGGGGAVPSRVVVLQEDDPKPGAVFGRLSFRQFNAETERIATAVEESIQRARDQVTGKETGRTTVDDGRMAATLSKGKRMRDGGDGATQDAEVPHQVQFKRPPAFDGDAFGGGGGRIKTAKKV